MVIHQEAETTSGGYQRADAGATHGQELRVCPFDYQLMYIILYK